MTTTQPSTTNDPAAIDPDDVERFVHTIIGDLGAAMSAVLIHIGDRLGLYQAMGDSRPVTPTELAARTGLAERYVREWCHNQTAAGWLSYDPAGTFTLPAALALLVADPSAPSFLLGGFDFVASAWADEELTVEAFRSGSGIGWHEHDHRLFSGTERFFRPGYQAHLIGEWIPALDGVRERLDKGGRIADVGCGHGAATIMLAEAFPACSVSGFDYHDESITRARQLAAEHGVAERTRFSVASAEQISGDYDLICLFDCLHDMGDPISVARHLRESLTPDGTLLLVEPVAGDRPEENHHPLGRLMYAASTMICTPASLAQPGALGLGNQVGPTRLTELLHQAGFGHARLAARTPVNLVFEVRA
jgi:2-polyprenyl-3-methyl-5-hydroxy-6-metoxy-1,4-benzoquinol methylase